MRIVHHLIWVINDGTALLNTWHVLEPTDYVGVRGEGILRLASLYDDTIATSPPHRVRCCESGRGYES
jgi:hypothetical protein